jgi:hypothetical protein
MKRIIQKINNKKKAKNVTEETASLLERTEHSYWKPE